MKPRTAQHLTRVKRTSLLLAGLVAIVLAPLGLALADTTQSEIDLLVKQLGDKETSTWEDAERQLIELAPTDSLKPCLDYLRQLPQPAPEMSDDLRGRLENIRTRVDAKLAERVIAPTRLSLITAGSELGPVFADIEQQTGNRLIDYREQFGETPEPLTWNFSLSDREFWPLVDKFLDATELDLYSSSGEEALAVVSRRGATSPRFGRACYVGPFRIEPLEVTSQRGLRQPNEQAVQVKLEIAWEPRLRPISLSQEVALLQATAADDSTLAVDESNPNLGAEVSTGTHAAELIVPLELPPRSVTSIKSLRGTLKALVAGRVGEFRFTNLDQADNVEQTQGGLRIVLVTVRKNQGLWEVHMRLEVNSEVPALDFQRGWAFQNQAFLENPAGEKIEHAGFETTMQNEHMVGLAYFFDLDTKNLKGYTWGYRTPVGIIEVPVEFELKDIPLP